MSLQRAYRTFDLDAYGVQLSSGKYAPRVKVIHRTELGVRQLEFIVPCEDGIDKVRAEKIAMDYGLRALKGEIPGFNPSALL